MNADYMDSLALTEELIGDCHPLRITVAQAFAKWAGFDLFAAAEEGSAALTANLAMQARKLGLDPMPGMTMPCMTAPQLYDLIFIHAVEPQLKTQGYTALLDYPAFVPCLAKKSPNGLTVERWELYYNGIELANCYSEENNPQAVKDFFISEEAEKQKTSLVRHNVDHDYWKIFENFPRCSGVAMGLDRLIMALTGKADINSVLPFAD
jgi:lysyl-tRNA synthetase class 2